MVRKLGGWLLAIIAGLSVVWIAWSALAGDKEALETKVAVVNGVIIDRESLDRETRGVQQRLLSTGRSLSDIERLQLRKNVLENLINLELLYQDAQEKGVKVEEAAIEEHLKTLKKRFSNEDDFKRALTQMKFSEAALRSQIKKTLDVQQLVDKQVARDIAVSEKEIRAYYDTRPDSFQQPEQVRASHILIKVDPQAEKGQKAEAREKLRKIQQRLKKGEDFSALAREFSQCPSSARGGDLGYFKRGQMVRPFEESVFALKPGETSDIVETKFGYHLIKCGGKKPKRTIPYEEIKEKLRGHLKNEKVRERVNAYIGQLKEKARVERFLKEN